jgi:hypothetical protein
MIFFLIFARYANARQWRADVRNAGAGGNRDTTQNRFQI